MKKTGIIFICIILLTSVFAFTASAEGGAGAGDGGAVAGNCLMDPTMIIMIVVMIAIFYFFMIRPENKKKKKLAEMRSSLSVGDTITTIGGMVGKVVSIDDDLITFETSEDRVRIQVTKWAVSTVGKATEETT